MVSACGGARKQSGHSCTTLRQTTSLPPPITGDRQRVTAWLTKKTRRDQDTALCSERPECGANMKGMACASTHAAAPHKTSTPTLPPQGSARRGTAQTRCTPTGEPSQQMRRLLTTSTTSSRVQSSCTGCFWTASTTLPSPLAVRVRRGSTLVIDHAVNNMTKIAFCTVCRQNSGAPSRLHLVASTL
jgi:hypothetical protein